MPYMAGHLIALALSAPASAPAGERVPFHSNPLREHQLSMHHNVSLIATLAAAFGLALILGFIAARLKLPALVGYLLAGIVLGPFTPGFIADVDLANQLTEIGVMLLMFGVGLHFSLDDLMEVKGIALPGAILQISAATLLGLGVATVMGWTFGAGLVFGLALSVASTVVLLRALEERGELDSLNGRIAVGWLVVEDLVMVLVLVMLPALSRFASSPRQSASLTARPSFSACRSPSAPSLREWYCESPN